MDAFFMSENMKKEVILMSGSAYDYLLEEYLEESIYNYYDPEKFTEKENDDTDEDELKDCEIPF